MSRCFSLLLLCLVLSACQPQQPVAVVPDTPKTVVANNGEDSGALSSDIAPAKPPVKPNVLKGTKWPELHLASGEAWISCENDASSGEGMPLQDIGFMNTADAMRPCKEQGLVRLRYSGKINSDFTELVQRVAAMADRLEIEDRILDIDSTGGRIEDAMPAGDAIAESHWLIRVDEGSICHSACVLVLAAGDDREIAGRIGIHRMIRVGSKADTRAQLSQELREVYGELKDYLERNGASVAVADLMMTVPNRSLRLLSETELQEYGLSGANAVQDDLDRIRLARKCGEDFVKRKNAYQRDYAWQCVGSSGDPQALSDCGSALRDKYGFPDKKCAAESPKQDILPPVSVIEAMEAPSDATPTTTDVVAEDSGAATTGRH